MPLLGTVYQYLTKEHKMQDPASEENHDFWNIDKKKMCKKDGPLGYFYYFLKGTCAKQ